MGGPLEPDALARQRKKNESLLPGRGPAPGSGGPVGAESFADARARVALWRRNAPGDTRLARAGRAGGAWWSWLPHPRRSRLLLPPCGLVSTATQPFVRHRTVRSWIGDAIRLPDRRRVDRIPRGFRPAARRCGR